MVKWTTLVIVAAVIIIAVIGIRALTKTAVSSVPSEQSNTESAASANTEIRSGIIEVDIRDFAFNPAELKIRAGTKVTWVNYDNAPHTVTSDSGGKTELNSQMLSKSDSYGHLFERAGTFPYHCNIDSNMKGKIVVVD